MFIIDFDHFIRNYADSVLIFMVPILYILLLPIRGLGNLLILLLNFLIRSFLRSLSILYHHYYMDRLIHLYYFIIVALLDIYIYKI